MDSKVSSQYIHVDKSRRIFVDHLKGTRNCDPCVLYVPGFLSHRKSEKGSQLFEYCSKVGLELIRYDPEGLGKSEFDSEEQWSTFEFGHWVQDCEAAMSVSKNKRFILVGSSMGGWISLLTYKKLKHRIVGMLLIAPAQNFITRKVAEGTFHVPDSSIASWIDVKAFAKKSEEFSIPLEPSANVVGVPLVILHGMKDDIIPPESSMELMNSIQGGDVELTFIKSGDHRLNEYMDKIIDNLDNLIKKSGPN